ncbi:MAG: DUF1707 domain-containing protein [Acidimicrobiales bacterium]
MRSDPMGKGGRLRLRRARRSLPDGGEAAGRRRMTDVDREQAARRLGRAQEEGRFGSSDLYEQRMESLLAARRQTDVDRLVGDLGDLVPSSVRARMLRVVARAHADGRLDMDELTWRTDRCLEPMTRARAEALVGDLGYRIVRPGRTRLVMTRSVRRVAVTAAAAGAAGAALVAVPAGLDLPGGFSQWFPLAIGTGVFTAAGAGIAAVAWLVRPGPRRLLAGPVGRGEDATAPGATLTLRTVGTMGQPRGISPNVRRRRRSVRRR